MSNLPPLAPFKIAPLEARTRKDIKAFYGMGDKPQQIEVPEHLLPSQSIDTSFDRESVIEDNPIPHIIPAFTGLRRAFHERRIGRQENRINRLAEDDRFVRFAARAVIQGGTGAGKNLWRDTDPANPDHMRPNTELRQQTLLRLERKWYKRSHAVRHQGTITSPYMDARLNADGETEFHVDFEKGLPRQLSRREQGRMGRVAHNYHAKGKKVRRIDEGFPLVREVKKGGIVGITHGPSSKAESARDKWEKSVLKLEALDRHSKGKSR